MSQHHHHGNRTKLWWVLALSSAYMIAEIVGGMMSGSLALFADAGHMAVDSAAVGLSLFAAWISHKPANPEKTYGYYRAEILAALLNGATLVALSLWICYEAYGRFSNPPAIQGKLMFLIATGGVCVNLMSLAMIHGGHGHDHENLNMHGVWLHIITDLLGSVSAVIAAILVWKGWPLADPIISVVISLFILFGSWKLLSECVNVLLEGVPKGMNLSDIQKSIESIRGVKDVHDLHVWTVTSGVPSLSSHVSLKEKADHADVLEKITAVLKDRFKIEHVTIQLEPTSFSHEDKCSLGH